MVKKRRVKKVVSRRANRKVVKKRKFSWIFHLLSILATFFVGLFFLSANVTGYAVSSGVGTVGISLFYLIGLIFFIAGLVETWFFLRRL